MERGTIAALIVAFASLIASVVWHHNARLLYYHAIALILPLGCIAFPEIVEAAYRSSFHGQVHGGSGATPAFVIRIAAWALLVVVVFVHHTVAFARGSAGQGVAVDRPPPTCVDVQKTPRPERDPAA